MSERTKNIRNGCNPFKKIEFKKQNPEMVADF